MIKMDEQMKALYSMVHGLDTTKCIEVVKPLGSLELRAGLPIQSLEDFVKNNQKPVCFENYSSKDILKEYSDAMKDKYVEFTRFYGLITHQFLDNPEMKPQAVGFIDTVHVYNGFPGVIDSKKFAEDPREAFNEGGKKLVIHPLLKIFVLPYLFNRMPEKFDQSKIFLLKDFCDKYVHEVGGK
jgi:hypothetical protein